MSIFDNIESNVSLTAQRKAARKAALEVLGEHFANQVVNGMPREVAIPAYSTFIQTLLPAGRGQADKAEEMANLAVDAGLAVLDKAEEAA